MAEWSKNKVVPDSINNGQEFIKGENLAINEFNAIVNNSFYASDIAENVANQISNLAPNEKIEFKGSNPNLLINGDFRVNQRGNTIAQTNSFLVDRWCGRHNNTTDKLVKLNDDGSIRLSALNVGWAYLDYTLENTETKALLGKTITLSMKIKNYTSADNLNSQIAIESVISGAVTTEKYTSFNSDGIITCTAVVDEADYIRVRASVNKNSSYDVVWAKLEIGSVATAFSPRPYEEELAMCQRYYQKYDSLMIRTTYTGSTNGQYYFQFITPLRTAPTLTKVSATTFAIRGSYSGSNLTTGTLSDVSLASTSGCRLTLNFNNTITAQDTICYITNLALDAEL